MDKLCKVTKEHADGDLSLQCGDVNFLLTTEGQLYVEIDLAFKSILAAIDPCLEHAREGDTSSWVKCVKEKIAQPNKVEIAVQILRKSQVRVATTQVLRSAGPLAAGLSSFEIGQKVAKEMRKPKWWTDEHDKVVRAAIDDFWTARGLDNPPEKKDK